MANNRAHNAESNAARLARLQSNPIEAIETLLNSLNNFFNNEIRLAPGHLQTSLMFLGIHAVALTVGEAFFDNRGRDKEINNYRDFLRTFVDGPTPDVVFSWVADELHNWRNIIAHQWIGSLGHRIEYDYSAILGWERRAGMLVVNPRIYCETYLAAFSVGGKIWAHDTLFTAPQLQAVGDRIVEKYIKR